MIQSSYPQSSQELACGALSAPATDGELLHRFVHHQDDDAFEELVRRHGPLVMGVCRRILHHDQDTEDAFQATFLVLARRAGSIRKQQSVASWLYKVAYRIALRARARKQERRAREIHACQQHQVSRRAPVMEWNEWDGWIDEEVQRLPEKYRTPVLMCYVQGQTNEEAARQLRCPTGTVKIRLLRARELLRKRLLRRGIGLSVAVVLAGLTRSAAATLPAELAATTIQLGSNIAAGQSLATLGLSESTLDLVRGWFQSVARAKLKVCYVVLMTLLLLILTDLLSQRAWGEASAKQLPPPVPEARPEPPGESPSFPLEPELEWIVMTNRAPG
jgi:RNA polymerase sigma factor (sigma-70 family)